MQQEKYIYSFSKVHKSYNILLCHVKSCIFIAFVAYPEGFYEKLMFKVHIHLVQDLLCV